MKKMILAITMSLSLLINSVMATTTTIKVKEVEISTSTEEGSTVEITPKTDEITEWLVKSGGVDVVDNKFVTPTGDVMIEGKTKDRYSLKIVMPLFSRTESKVEGQNVTVEVSDFSPGYNFENWTVSGISLTVEQESSTSLNFVMPKCDVKLVANYTKTVGNTDYTIRYDTNGGDIVIESQGKPEGVSIILRDERPKKVGYKFLGWSTNRSATTPEYECGDEFDNDEDTILYAVWEPRTINVDNSGANAPVLIDGLYPVNWNGVDWEPTTLDNWEYNYNSVAEVINNSIVGNGDGAWANAKTEDGSLYVWIPRYTYKIVKGYMSSGNSWNDIDNPGENRIAVKFSNGTNDFTVNGVADSSEGFVKQPAFTFGDDELEGIWVAKYEASWGPKSTLSVVDKPSYNKYAMRSVPNVSSIFKSISGSYDRAYRTFRNADSHMMKNDEWAAVAYLTNAIGRKPYKNNSVVTGISSIMPDDSKTIGKSNKWNTINGVKASNTHNIYGIYDLVGGKNEYMSAYFTGGNSTYLSNDVGINNYGGLLYENRDTKYVEKYENSEDLKEMGVALYETSADLKSWDATTGMLLPSEDTPFFRRGGDCEDFGKGVFWTGKSSGASYSDNGFRVVLSFKTN